MTDTQLELLFVTGDRVHLTLDQALYGKCGFDKDSYELFKVGDLREYLFKNWEEIVSECENFGNESTVNIHKQPASADRIQILHMGQRLDPNTLMNSLNLNISHVLHIVVKPEGMNMDSSPEKNRFDRFTTQFRRPTKGKRRGSTSNKPVPAFVTSAVHRPRATQVATSNEGSSNEINSNGGNRNNTGKTENINDTRNPTVTNQSNNHTKQTNQTRPASVPSASSSDPKSSQGCCIIM